MLKFFREKASIIVTGIVFAFVGTMFTGAFFMYKFKDQMTQQKKKVRFRFCIFGVKSRF